MLVKLWDSLVPRPQGPLVFLMLVILAHVIVSDNNSLYKDLINGVKLLILVFARRGFIRFSRELVGVKEITEEWEERLKESDK